MADKITREIDAYKALRREAKKANAPTRERVSKSNPFTIDAN